MYTITFFIYAIWDFCDENDEELSCVYMLDNVSRLNGSWLESCTRHFPYGTSSTLKFPRVSMQEYSRSFNLYSSLHKTDENLNVDKRI